MFQNVNSDLKGYGGANQIPAKPKMNSTGHLSSKTPTKKGGNSNSGDNHTTNNR